MPLNSTFARKKYPCKNKNVQQTNSYFSNQLFKVHEHMPSALAAALINGLVSDIAWTQPRQKLTAASVQIVIIRIQDRFCSTGNPLSNWRLLKPF